MKTIYTAVFCLFFISAASAQAPGQPYFPETANGASNIPYQYHSLKWQNPGDVVYNEVYLGFDSSKVTNLDPSSLFISGYPSTVFDSVLIDTQLFYPTRYFWCVVEYNADGSAQGETWYFNTSSPFIDYVKADDFSFGLGKWSITSSGCGWQLENENGYLLPDPSTGKVLAADAFICGAISSVANFEIAEDMQYMAGATLDFNSDLSLFSSADNANVDMSTDGGATWSLLWQPDGSNRNEHVSVILFDQNGVNDTIYTVQIRFYISMPGPDGWWAIDNVAIQAYDGLLTHNHPYITSVNVNYENGPKSVLKWQQPIPAPGDIIQRKQGTPLSNTAYETIADIQGANYNTFIDSTINDSSIYTYRIGIPEMSYWYIYSNEATAYAFPPVPVELMSFSGKASGYDIQLNWITATETNNRGFMIERKGLEEKSDQWNNISFIKGNGTTAQSKSYSYIDKNLPAGNYQYRLKQIDFDGSSDYSRVVEVSIDSPGEFSLAQNYPNPFNPETNLSYVIGHSSFVSIRVYDVLGNEVALLVNEVKQAGKYALKFDGSNLASGIYIYRIKAVPTDAVSGDFTASKKLILLK